MNKETKRFISEHEKDDIFALKLHYSSNSEIDIDLAIRQIAGKQKIKSKIPLYYHNDNILYPVQLSLEQSSSESTAKYKSNLCKGKTLVDLTGGFGIDCYFMAEHFEKVIYVERQAELCDLATHNFKILGRDNIQVIHSETEEYIPEMEHVDWIYIDPARRSSSGNKVVVLSDCEPNVSALSTILLEKGNKVMIKLSPMIDITAAIRELPNTSEIHIVSVDNECKEVLLLLDQTIKENKKLSTINIAKKNINQCFDYYIDEESASEVCYSSELEKYLYEPNASIMKSGAFKSIGNRFNLYKLHKNSHLYTSAKLIQEFPGRIFEVQKCWENSKNELKCLSKVIPKANISVRNYPISVDELRKKLKIKEGGDIYLFASTLSNGKKVIIECKKYSE